MKLTIHQPEHLPWLGFFHKIAMSDIYVVLDNVQYRRRYFQNRNRIRTRCGERYVTTPVVKETRDDLLIKDVKIYRDDPGWKQKNIKSVMHAYSKAAYFKDYFEELRDIYLKDFDLLRDLNLELIRYLARSLGIKTRIIMASSLSVGGAKGDLILNICEALKAPEYISGISGKDYLNMEDFNKAGISVTYQEFHHPVYKQLYEPFLPRMSIIDLLFNHGNKSLGILNGFGVSVMDKVIL